MHQQIRRQLEIASRGQMTIFDGDMVAGLTKLGFSMEELNRFVTPRRTLSRRIAKGEPLSLQENDSALRLVRVMELAESVLGESERAQHWLRKPNRALGGIAPIDFLESESGAIIVAQALHQNRFGP